MKNISEITLRRAKTFLIFALIALAIYQTGQLWFVNLSNRNFFLFLSARFTPSVSDRNREFVRPMRMVSGAGDGRFIILYGGLMDMPPRTYFDNVITEMFSGGIFVGVADTDYERLFSRPVLVYEYAFPMPGNVFPLGFNQRTGAFLTQRGVTEFTAVAIWPPHDNQGIRVFFIGDGRTWEFSLYTDGFEFYIPPVSADSMHFVSAALEGFEFLPPGTFVAQDGDRVRFAYFPLIVTNPYHTRIGGSLNHIRNQVAHFFDNPATITPRVAGDGVWTFSNIHTAVRYFDTDVLEYTSFRPRSQNATSSFLDDFSAAWAFIDADPNVINEFFLTGFEERGTTYVFWFGYIVDNFPIMLPDGWRVSSQDDILPAPIEVVVDRGRVAMYRRLAHNFHPDDVHDRLELDLDGFMATREGPLEGLILGYRMRQRGNLQLEWWGWYAEVYETEEDYPIEEEEAP